MKHLVATLTVLLSLALASPAAAVDPTVKLLEAGQGKKSELRLAPTVGTKSSSTMTMDMSMEMAFGGQTMPAQAVPQMLFAIETEVNEVRKDEFTFTFKYAKADIGESTSLPPQAVESMREVIKQLEGLEGHSTMTTRGFVKDGSFVPAEGAGPEIQEMAANMEKQLNQLAAPLPAEPVGVGAKWQVDSVVTDNGMKIDQTAVYTLQRREGNRVELAVAITQSAKDQTVKTPQGDAKLSTLSTSGTGTSSLDLTLLLPIEAKSDTQSDVSMNMDMGGSPVAMDMKTAIDMTISTAKQ